MVGEWVEVPFAEAIDFQEGPGIMAADFRDQGVPLIRLAGLERGGTVLAGCNFLDPSTVQKRWAHFALREGDILLSSSASLGRIAVVGPDAEGAISYTGIIRMRPRDERVHAPFIRYLLEAPDFQRQAEVAGVGSVMRHFGPMHLRQMTVSLPPAGTQRRIAEILGALDEKIELNRQLAVTLEGLARAAYAELQATHADECLVGSIADVAVNPRDQVDPRQVDPSTPYIGLEHMPRGRIVLGVWGQAANAESGKMSFERNDILFGKLRPYFRKVGVVPTSGICSTDILVIRARRPEDLGYVLAAATDAAFIEASNAASTGTRMPRTSWSDLIRYPLPIPPTSARAAFTKRVWPLIERAQAAAFENSPLQQVRDTLLSRLLSGDIEVAT